VKTLALTIAAILPISASLAQAPTGGIPSAIYVDPPSDPAHPASTIAIQIPSHGSIMNGFLYRPAGSGPFPLVVLLHGLPGNEQNLDLAQALRRDGWAVMTFNYRGNFGSEGQFSIDHAIEDVKVAVAYSALPATAKAWNIDAGRIVVIGHSMGGLAAALSATSEPKRGATILLAPWDPSRLATVLRPLSVHDREVAATDRWGDVTDGRLTGISSVQIAEQIVDHGDRWTLANAADGLADRPLLIVTASRDSPVNKGEHLRAALQRRGAKVSLVNIDSDHVFDDKRIELETVVINWLLQLRENRGR
jgi:uncharacterized protein